MADGIVGGQDFAVDASMIRAYALRQRVQLRKQAGVPRTEQIMHIAAMNMKKGSDIDRGWMPLRRLSLQHRCRAAQRARLPLPSLPEGNWCRLLRACHGAAGRAVHQRPHRMVERRQRPTTGILYQVRDNAVLRTPKRWDDRSLDGKP
jgi:hypothetical protein